MKEVVEVLTRTMDNTDIKTGQKALEFILIDYKKRGVQLEKLHNKLVEIENENEILKQENKGFKNFFSFIKNQITQ